MLSAETAAGEWPEEAVLMMDSIARAVERDGAYMQRVRLLETPTDPTIADSLAHACMRVADTMPMTGIIVFTCSGSSARRVARERPAVPILVLSPSVRVARRVALLWGRTCGGDQGHRQLRGDDRQGQAHGAAPRLRQRGQPTGRDGGRAPSASRGRPT